MYPHDHDRLKRQVPFPNFFWSQTKEVIGTAEAIRTEKGELLAQSEEKIGETAQELTRLIREMGLDLHIKVSPISTAINIAPIINGTALDKDWAAGRILLLADDAEIAAQSSIGIGDGRADFLFSKPLVNGQRLDVAFAFVGKPNQKPEEKELLENLVIEAKNYSGPDATMDILEELKDRFITKPAQF